MSRKLDFEHLHNIRDLGGMLTAGGRRIREGRLIRCGHLSDIDDDEVRKLSELVGTVIDFRTEGERKEKPDRMIPGAEYLHIPIMDSLTAGITHEAKSDREIISRLMLRPAEAKEYMCGVYRAFVTGDTAVSRYAEFLRILTAEHEGAVLWHCTAGKDRAGVAAAILEEILGVPREEIIGDYLMTNRYLEQDILFLTGMIKEKYGTDSPLADESLRYLFGAERAFIDAFYAAADSEYGGFSSFVGSGLGITGDEIRLLKDLYCC